MNAKENLVADIPLITDFATDGRAAIRLTVGRLESVGLEVYDARGARVRTLWVGVAPAGAHVRV